jgi:hypothetical protein
MAMALVWAGMATIQNRDFIAKRDQHGQTKIYAISADTFILTCSSPMFAPQRALP